MSLSTVCNTQFPRGSAHPRVDKDKSHLISILSQPSTHPIDLSVLIQCMLIERQYANQNGSVNNIYGRADIARQPLSGCNYKSYINQRSAVPTSEIDQPESSRTLKSWSPKDLNTNIESWYYSKSCSWTMDVVFFPRPPYYVTTSV